MSLIEIQDVKKEYKVRKYGKTYSLMAVNGVSFNVEEGRCVGLVGESGCGKSTLGRLIVGLENPSEGSIAFNGEIIHKNHSRKNPSKLRFSREIQLVFQDSYDAVNPKFTAKKIIEEPLKNFTDLNPSQRDEKVEELLEQVGLVKEDKEKFAMEFSGGQLQRVCIARALASDPKVFVLDEPLSSLDVSVQAQILNLLSDIKKEMNLSYVLISHDIEAVYYLADALVVMYGGQIMEKIDDLSYFEKMVHPYTKKLLSSIPVFEKRTDVTESAETIGMDVYVQNNTFKGCPYYGRCPDRIEECKESKPEMKELATGHFVACHVL